MKFFNKPFSSVNKKIFEKMPLKDRALICLKDPVWVISWAIKTLIILYLILR